MMQKQEIKLKLQEFKYWWWWLGLSCLGPFFSSPVISCFVLNSRLIPAAPALPRVPPVCVT